MQANIKRQKQQTSVKNVVFMSAKTAWRDIIPVNRKGNILYDIFAMKVAFSRLYFVFSLYFVYILYFVLFLFSVIILSVLKSVAFKWCEEWVIAVQTILW